MLYTMTDIPVPGRRERKKAATRQAIADAALELFLAGDYDHVSVRDIAERADVSTTTLFKHFPRKEALVFDREDDVRTELAQVVKVRAHGQGVLDALRAHALTDWVAIASDPQLEQLEALIAATPALREYEDRMWARQAAALGAVIAEEMGRDADDLACAALARFILDIPSLAAGRDDPRTAVDELFDLLTDGWRGQEQNDLVSPRKGSPSGDPAKDNSRRR
jgi:AcrR family transcriptional regulator